MDILGGENMRRRKCDGKSKIRSKGRGRGLGRGKGRGPISPRPSWKRS
ncbi:MAG: hypothetical protein ACTSQG_06290 [Promethearchaeota archaeon]